MKESSATNIVDYLDLEEAIEGFAEMPQEEQDSIRDHLREIGKDPRIKAGVKFTKRAHSVYHAMVLCTCVSHNRSDEAGKIAFMILEDVAGFVGQAAEPLATDPSDDAINAALFEVMLYARGLAEDALGVPRYNGTPKGS